LRPLRLTVLGAFWLGALGFASEPAGACSCMAPEATLISPDRGSDVPLNTRVRIALPSYFQAGATGSVPKLVLSAVGGQSVAVAQQESKLGSLRQLELVPERPLAAETRYQVALVTPDRHPSTLVFGTFRTGRAMDTRSPTTPKLGNAVIYREPHPMGSACQVGTPWIEIPTSSGADPDRPGAQLLWAVWLAGANGVLNDKAMPTAFLSASNGVLKIGKTSLCDPRDFPLSGSGRITFGIAQIDEAGNHASPTRVRVSLAKAQRPRSRW
jgi:hypothetical protein